jgi:hypothetical protein
VLVEESINARILIKGEERCDLTVMVAGHRGRMPSLARYGKRSRSDADRRAG